MAMTKATLKKYPPDISLAQTVCTQQSVKEQPIGLSMVKFSMVSSGLADVKLVGQKLSDTHYVHLLATRHGIFGTILMIGQNDETVLYRLVVSLGKLTERKSTDGEITYGICKSQPLTLEELQSLIDERSIPFKMKAVDPVWLTRFGGNERKANGFRRGRTFIMGDAAHCHSPAGG